ncbi:hypothetical protein DPMN_149100 [Dreissena polymorpha]|uniref:Uncharacterized protein n=1 Tax=Dreissena polymorpha TaxID=45954 RepID=A0A9D4J0U6_DREPO|nr:hypothetical protein DPMN_149100 [Dreissena polymorpha]
MCEKFLVVSTYDTFQGNIASKAKFHITSGHDTVMGRLTIFGDYSGGNLSSQTAALSLDSQLDFDLSKDYLYQDELLTAKQQTVADSGISGAGPVKQYALIQFEKPVTCQQHALIIGSKLDTDIHANVCRIAFHGRILLGISDPQSVASQLSKVKVYKTKVKEGLVERVMDTYTVIGKNLFKKETNVASFTGLKIQLSTGEAGVIEGGFGQSGKIKIRIPAGLQEDIVKKYSGGKKKSKKGEEESTNQEDDMDKEPIKIILTFKRYIYDLDKKMKQS